MQKDYLWDKSGEIDAEIESLENALQIFRFEPSSAPVALAPVVQPKKSFRETARRWTILVSPAAAGLIVLGLFFGWSQRVDNRRETNDKVVKTTGFEKPNVGPLIQSENADKRRGEFVDKPTIAKFERAVRIASTRKARFVKKSNIFQHNLMAESGNIKKELQLTDEERYAYTQLMRALQITSSKLELVQRKAQGEKEEKHNSRS